VKEYTIPSRQAVDGVSVPISPVYIVNPNGTVVAPFNTWDSVPMTTDATADPGAGAQPAGITVPIGRKWLFYGARFQVVTDANVANRYPYIRFRGDGANDDSAAMDTTAVTASITANVSFMPFATSAAGGVTPNIFHVVGIGPRELGPGSVVLVQVLNLQATDDISLVRFYYKEAPA